MAAAFSSGAIAFGLLGTRVGRIFAALIGALNIFVSFGTMANSARYKLRNEEARIIFNDEKMQHSLKAVFSFMDSRAREAIPLEDNPFVEDLEKQVDTFLENAKYYDLPEATEFLAAYERLKANINDPKAIREFQWLLTTKFIVNTYHENSYLQESLVNIYKTCEEMYVLLTQDIDHGLSASRKAEALFLRLHRFCPRLEKSLQRGPVRFGFLKKRRLMQWDCAEVFKYFYGLFCWSSRSRSNAFAPIATETLGIVKQLRHLSAMHKSKILRREIRDVEGLYWATRESDIGSLIFMAGFLVFVASVLFTIARIFSIDILVQVAFWASLASTFGAVLASFHFWRKLFILLKLQRVLGAAANRAQTVDDVASLREVRRITWTRILLTLVRLFAASAAAVALPWSVAENGFGDRISTSADIPFWIAFAAVVTAVGAAVAFFIVEYVVHYNLPPKLGEFVGESFRSEIEAMFEVFSLPINDIDAKQVQERETWEYVAREFLHRYRFDAVFAADRVGSILQYIQGGMVPRQSMAL
jgi:hypothetical protein